MSNTLRYLAPRTEVCHAIMESNEVGPVEAKIRCLTVQIYRMLVVKDGKSARSCSISSRYHQLVFQKIKPNRRVCPVALDTRGWSSNLKILKADSDPKKWFELNDLKMFICKELIIWTSSTAMFIAILFHKCKESGLH